MAKNDNLADFLQDIADTIRTKRGITGPISAQNFATEISAIEGGGTTTPDMPVIGDGKTYLYIKIDKPGRMTVPLYFSQTVANGVTIDWGDGSVGQRFGSTGNVGTTHTYAEIGEYIISLNPRSGCTLGLGSNSSVNCVMGSTSNNGKVYCSMLRAVEIGRNVTSIGDYAFYYCNSLSSIIIPDGVTSIGNNAFQYCYSLSSIVIPDSITRINRYAFGYCYSLSSITIQDGMTNIGNYAFYSCYSLSSIVIPDSVTNIYDYAFYQCYSLSSIVIPEGVISIGNNAFQNCYGMAFYDFSQCTSVPTLGGTTVFSSIPSDCKIVVPDNLYDTWKVATNWAQHESKMIKASEFNS